MSAEDLGEKNVLTPYESDFEKLALEREKYKKRFEDIY